MNTRTAVLIGAAAGATATITALAITLAMVWTAEPLNNLLWQASFILPTTPEVQK